MTILLVDDSALSSSLLTAALSNAGHHVRAVAGGRQALEALRQAPCQLVLCDWEMPGMDGLELCRLIRRQEFGRPMRVVLLSAHGCEDAARALAAGADAFLTKPISPAQLVERIGPLEHAAGEHL